LALHQSRNPIRGLYNIGHGVVNSMRYMLANMLLFLLPPTRWFQFKRYVLRKLGIKVGSGTNICGGVQFFGGGLVEIGSDCWIGLNTKFITSPNTVVHIADNCDIAPEVIFMCGTHEIGDSARRAGAGRGGDIVIGAGSWIGVRSTLLGGAVLQGGNIVGAGTLVRGLQIAPDTLVHGVPGRVARSL
jgi:maltose O-acetyltransferase